MSSLSDVVKRVMFINESASELMNIYEELRGDYLEVSRERDELLERVKELEDKNEHSC